jgi:hypothetical protein
MAITNTRITSANTPSTVFTAVGQQAITVMYLANTDSSTAANVSVYCVDNSASSGSSDENCIYKDLSITAGDTYVMDLEKLILDNGDFLDVQASAGNVITVTVSSISV